MMMSSMINKKTYRAFFVCVLAFVVYLILYNANWTFNDDHQFLKTTAVNKLLTAWSGSGRYWPLGLFDYNILLLIPYGYTIEAHLIHNTVIMALSFFILSNLLNKITENNYFISLFVVLFLMISNGFIYTHMTCICPERMMMFCFILFMYFYWKGCKLQSTQHYCFAVLSIIYATYLKEPVFGMIAVLALTNLIFQNKALTRKDKLFNYALLINSLIWLGLYFHHYTDTRCLYHNPGIWHIKNIFKFANDFIINEEPIFIIVCICSLTRAYHVFFKKDREHVFFDGLLFSAISYAGFYFVIGFRGAYYKFPTIVLSIPVLAYWINYLRSQAIIYKIIISVLIIVMMWNTKSTYKQSIRWILNMRTKDHLVQDLIANTVKAGRRVVYLHGDDMKRLAYTRMVWPIILNYKLKSNTNAISVINIENINDADLVLSSDKLPNPIKQALLKLGFVRTGQSIDEEFIYQHKKYTASAINGL